MLHPYAFLKRNSFSVRAPFAFLLFLGLALPIFGQSNYAVLSGTVTDPNHLPVAGASIQLTARSTGAIRKTVTNQDGLFEAPALPPDDYDLQVQAPGFAPAKESLRLEVNQKLAVAIGLKVGPVSQAVEIVASTEVLHTSDASVGEVVEPQSINELPLNGRML
ncbi:MAG: carboxypeptidase-like regulatory domain-containing protein, partial [Candidatus Acidiferrales bacterium]